jgi:cell fate (sporulation/competence/biofilm development) regulator YlbF (YheA/YmcA/DUF963 family)
MSSEKIHPLVVLLGVDVAVDKNARLLNKHLLDQDAKISELQTTVKQLQTTVKQLQTTITNLQSTVADIQGQLSKVHIRDLISAFRNHVIRNFSDLVDPNSERGKMNMKHLKNYSELIKKIKGASEGSVVANKVKQLSSDLDFNYIELIDISDETSDAWGTYRDLAHKLLGFLQSAPDERDQEAINEAQDIVEKLTPNSKRISSKLLEVVVRDGVVLEDTSRSKSKKHSISDEPGGPSRPPKTPRK